MRFGRWWVAAAAAVFLAGLALLLLWWDSWDDDPLAACRGHTVWRSFEDATVALRYEDREVKSSVLLEPSRIAASLSPDGRRIAYYRVDAASGRAAVYVASADGKNERQVAETGYYPGFAHIQPSPSWSPRSDFIAFEFSHSTGILETGFTDIVLAKADGTRTVNLTHGESFASTAPSWSPDGNQIVFVGEEEPMQASNVFVVRTDGSGLHRLTTSPAPGQGSSWAPAWSPRGDLIAFVSNRDINGEIYVMRPDGSGQTNLTRHPAGDFSVPEFAGSPGHGALAWSPDGRKIVFKSERDGFEGRLYAVNADGSGLVKLTEGPGYAPRWSADGGCVTYQFNDAVYIVTADGSARATLYARP